MYITLRTFTEFPKYNIHILSLNCYCRLYMAIWGYLLFVCYFAVVVDLVAIWG